MNMPTPCAECNEWCEFDSVKSIGNELYCDECHAKLEGEE